MWSFLWALETQTVGKQRLFAAQITDAGPGTRVNGSAQNAILAIENKAEVGGRQGGSHHIVRTARAWTGDQKPTCEQKPDTRQYSTRTRTHIYTLQQDGWVAWLHPPQAGVAMKNSMGYCMLTPGFAG